MLQQIVQQSRQVLAEPSAFGSLRADAAASTNTCCPKADSAAGAEVNDAVSVSSLELRSSTQGVPDFERALLAPRPAQPSSLPQLLQMNALRIEIDRTLQGSRPFSRRRLTNPVLQG